MSKKKIAKVSKKKIVKQHPAGCFTSLNSKYIENYNICELDKNK
jgi:hypothetical protein